jgi:hypothetical protein
MAFAFHEIRNMPESLGNDSSIRLPFPDHDRTFSQMTSAGGDAFAAAAFSDAGRQAAAVSSMISMTSAVGEAEPERCGFGGVGDRGLGTEF